MENEVQIKTGSTSKKKNLPHCYGQVFNFLQDSERLDSKPVF